MNSHLNRGIGVATVLIGVLLPTVVTSGAVLRHANPNNVVVAEVDCTYESSFHGHGGFYDINEGVASAFAMGEDLPNFNVGCSAEASIQTTIGGGNSFTVMSPGDGLFNTFGVAVEGETYDSLARTFSGIGPGADAPGQWLIDVLPSGDEELGTPVMIEIDASVAGWVAGNGTDGNGRAEWMIGTDHGVVLDDSAFGYKGGGNFSDSGNLTFEMLLGESFSLDFLYAARSYGSIDITGSESWARFDDSLISVTATVIPEPSSVAILFAGCVALLWRRRSVS